MRKRNCACVVGACIAASVISFGVARLEAFEPGGASSTAQGQWVVYDGFPGPGNGKHVVLISGDEEYRSEEVIPQLGKILAKHHGFKCTVLFAVNRQTGEIDPETLDNIPGLEALEHADLMVIFTRYRNLPPEQMKPIVDYIQSGRPIVGLRTATHAFQFDDPNHPYAKWDNRSTVPGYEGGFGRCILGETWIAHHGEHGEQSTRGRLAEPMRSHPVVRGYEDIWGPTDVYAVRLPLPGDSVPLVLGQVLDGMTPDAKPVAGPKNDPMMPIAWIKTYKSGGTDVTPVSHSAGVTTGEPGVRGRVFTTTMGAAPDFESEGLRRLLVNACYWAVGLEEQIPPRANVELIGRYHALPFGFGGHRRGVRPADHQMSATPRSSAGR